MSETAFEPLGEHVYEAKRTKSLRFGALLLAIGVAAAWPALRAAEPWLHGGPLPAPGPIVMLIGAALLCGLGVLGFIGAFRGLPRLTLSRDGVELETLFGTKWANWSSLSACDLVAANHRVVYISCAIAGDAVSDNLANKKKLTIPDAFLAPIASILADLQARHARIRGVAPPPAPVAAEASTPRFGIAGFTAPWLTFAILLVLALVFAAEQLYAVDEPPSNLRPSLISLVAMGGLNRDLVLDHGEWYRLFTAPLLHADLMHLLFNGVALLMVGYQLERLVGRLWFAGFYFLGAFGGALLSLALNPENLTSVGASGAIMGLFGASYLGSFRLPAEARDRWRMQIRSVQVLVPSLIPLATSGSSDHIDYAAHFGGVLTGAAVMFLVLKAWPDASPLPPLRSFAAGIAVLGLVLIGAGSVDAKARYRQYQSLGALIPQAQMPKTQFDGEARSRELIERYPADPRGHMYRGASLIAARDRAGAEREFRAALQQAEELRFYFGPQLGELLRAMLVAVLLDGAKRQEAKEAALPLCRPPARDRLPEPLRKMLIDQQLCGAGG